MITDPITGAKKGGIRDFFKGVGTGIVGIVVKPVVGVTDSVVSVVQVCDFYVYVRVSVCLCVCVCMCASVCFLFCFFCASCVCMVAGLCFVCCT